MEGISLIRQSPRALLFVALLLGCIALSPSKAFASQVRCGETISHDTRLDNDLIDCPGDGLVIGTDDVTLDFHGHTIDGVGQGAGVAAVGSQDAPGPNRVTVQNGTIREFRSGVSLEYSTGSNVRKLKVSESAFGIVGVRSPHASIEQNDMLGSGIGIAFGGYARIEDNQVVNAGIIGAFTGGDLVAGNFVDGGGIVFGMGGGNRLENNVVLNSASGISISSARNDVVGKNVVSGGKFGVLVSTFAAGNEVRENVVANNSEVGIWLGHSLGDSELFPNRIEQNVIYGNGKGIVDDDDGNSVVAGNRIYSNLGNGINIGQTASKFQIIENRVTANGGDGVLIGESCCAPLIKGDALIENNVAKGNADDGIDVDKAVIILRSNRTTKNVDFGIEAVPETIDGGGNRAFGNGNPLQCLNVICK